MRLTVKIIAMVLIASVGILFILWPFGRWVKVVPAKWDPYCAWVNIIAEIITLVAMWGVWQL